ncbi:DUF397 domain-containing protein [Streptomyces marokkonensis]|uniref:DUF397 domain-containing protein n=1 Tax=Streptomyces marokkonensis TaxID=324855 RepID=UPI003138242F
MSETVREPRETTVADQGEPEAAPPEPGMKNAVGLAWFKGTYSSGEGGQCVEVATCQHVVHVRDTKDTNRPGSGDWFGDVGGRVRGVRG